MTVSISKYYLTPNVFWQQHPMAAGFVFCLILIVGVSLFFYNEAILARKDINDKNSILDLPTTMTVFTFAETLFLTMIIDFVKKFLSSTTKPDSYPIVGNLIYSFLLLLLSFFAIYSSIRLTVIFRNNVISVDSKINQKFYLSFRTLFNFLPAFNIFVVGYIILFA